MSTGKNTARYDEPTWMHGKTSSLLKTVKPHSVILYFLRWNYSCEKPVGVWPLLASSMAQIRLLPAYYYWQGSRWCIATLTQETIITGFCGMVGPASLSLVPDRDGQNVIRCYLRDFLMESIRRSLLLSHLSLATEEGAR